LRVRGGGSETNRGGYGRPRSGRPWRKRFVLGILLAIEVILRLRAPGWKVDSY
jgi:hypothetical protein